MPEPQTEQRRDQEREKRKDPYKGFDIEIPGFSGINTTLAVTEIQDHECPAIFNYLPVAKNSLRKIAPPLPILSSPLSQDVIKLVNDVLSGNLIMFAILADGSMGLISGGNYTQIAVPGTFSTNPSFIDIVNWQNQVFLIVDKNAGLWLFNGTNAAALSVPSAPTLGQQSSGSLAQTTYFVKITYVNAWGETIPSTESSLTVSANNVLTVQSPSAETGATGWNVYAGTSSGTETLQNTTPISIGTNWTEPTSGLTSGAQMPGTNTTAGLSLISASLTGRAICVWQGRVFIVNGRTLTYSVADSYLDFVSTGSGYFTIPHSDLKQEVMRITPYMDSLYYVGDHGVIAMTGTTISNDPTTWYQMEIFNNAGTIYGCLLQNWNNTLFNVNEFGIWMMAATQSQLLNYKIDLSQFTFENYPGTIAQIGTLNFFLIPILQYSPLSQTTQNMLLAYCIELREFYFIDLGFPIKGAYQTLSETDHSLYVWGNKQIYRMFAGTGSQSCLITMKTFDLQDPFVYKAIRYLLLSLNIRTGSPSFMINCNVQQGNTGFATASAYQAPLTFQRFMFFGNKNYPIFDIALKNSYGQLMVLKNSEQQFLYDLMCWFSIIPPWGMAPFAAWNVAAGVGGTKFNFSIQENSNAVFDIEKLKIKGFIGRRLR